MNHILPEGHRTDRLTFSRVNEVAKSEWLPFFEDRESTRYLGLPDGTADEQCQRWIDKQLSRYENGNGLNLLRRTEDGVLIGMCGALFQEVDGQQVTEIAYHILPQFRHQGYGSEAARAVRVYLFDNELEVDVISIIHRDNIFSAKVAHRNGMLVERETTYQDMPVVIYKAQKYLSTVSFGEYLGAFFVLALVALLFGWLIREYLM